MSDKAYDEIKAGISAVKAKDYASGSGVFTQEFPNRWITGTTNTYTFPNVLVSSGNIIESKEMTVSFIIPNDYRKFTFDAFGKVVGDFDWFRANIEKIPYSYHKLIVSMYITQLDLQEKLDKLLSSKKDMEPTNGQAPVKTISNRPAKKTSHRFARDPSWRR